MNTNKITIVGTIVIILFIISIPTIYKVVKNHNVTLYKVVEEEIIAAAKKCYFEGNCLNEKIFLKELYDLKYLDTVSNPITKENYNEKSYIIRKENSYEFIVEE